MFDVQEAFAEVGAGECWRASARHSSPHCYVVRWTRTGHAKDRGPRQALCDEQLERTRIHCLGSVVSRCDRASRTRRRTRSFRGSRPSQGDRCGCRRRPTCVSGHRWRRVHRQHGARGAACCSSASPRRWRTSCARRRRTAGRQDAGPSRAGRASAPSRHDPRGGRGAFSRSLERFVASTAWVDGCIDVGAHPQRLGVRDGHRRDA